jgi:hypothetical protein
MKTGDDRQTETESTPDTKTRHKKRPWESPILTLEDARRTASKISNPMEFTGLGTMEGAAS